MLPGGRLINFRCPGYVSSIPGLSGLLGQSILCMGFSLVAIARGQAPHPAFPSGLKGRKVTPGRSGTAAVARLGCNAVLSAAGRVRHRTAPKPSKAAMPFLRRLSPSVPSALGLTAHFGFAFVAAALVRH